MTGKSLKSLEQASQILARYNIDNKALLDDIAKALDCAFEEAQEMVNHSGRSAIEQYSRFRDLQDMAKDPEIQQHLKQTSLD